jgi:glyoxylase-like metal-dependent hydrolase (beta-lactamase superfamily II)
MSKAERVSDLVRLVRAPNPSPITLEGTNTYLIGDRAPVVIDPGPAIQSHLDAVMEEAGDVSLVLLTHRHPDHAESAERFAAAAKAPLAAWASAPVDGCEPHAVADGQRVAASGATLTAMFTPGHASDHLSFLLEEEGALFTGDHVLGRGTTVIAWPDGNLAAYMASLDRARAARPKRLYPGHGPVVDDPAPVLDYYVEHRLQREREVLGALDAGDETIEQMVARIYAAYDRALWGAAALSVRAHLEKLRAEDAVAETEGKWRKA